MAWLGQLEPIRRASDDFLHRAPIAQRIADELLESPEGFIDRERRRSISVRGPFGVGKSSTIFMAEEIALRQAGEELIFVHTNCWGFESSAKAQEHVLDACVSALTERVDCNMLRPVPAFYADAFQKPEGWFGSLMVLAFGATTPVAELKRFTDPLRAIGAHLVVIIEDADRNGDSFDPNQVLAMLHYMREVPRMAFIVSASTEVAIDLYKVTDDVVYLDSTPWQVALGIIDRVRIYALGRSGYTDPEGLRDGVSVKRPRSLVENARTGEQPAGIFVSHPPNWPKELALLLGSVRVMKAALREFLGKWDALWGEVDPDELLIVCGLRHGAPEAYDFLQRNAHLLAEIQRMNKDQRNSNEAKVMVESLKSDWERTIKDGGFDGQSSAIVIGRLFRSMADVTSIPAVYWHASPQSISASGGKYLERMHSGVVDSSDISDRKLFSLISRLKTSIEPAAAEIEVTARSDGRWANAIVEADNLLKCLATDRRLALLSHALDFQRAAHGREASVIHGEAAPWLQWFTGAGLESEPYFEWGAEQIRKSLPRHRKLAAELTLHLSEVPGLRSRVAEGAREWLPRGFEGITPREFASERDFNSLTALRYLFEPVVFVRSPKPLPAWLPKLFLDAVREFPDPMVIGGIFTFSKEPNFGAENADQLFHHKAVTNFFGELARDFYKVIAQAPNLPAPWPPRYLEVARDSARLRMTELDMQTGNS